MIRIILTFLWVFLVSVISPAQSTPLTITVDNPGKEKIITVTNQDVRTVTAFTITVSLSQTSAAETRIVYDIYSNYKHDNPIPPGASKLIPLPHVVGSPLPQPELRAAVFSDGTSWGDTQWINKLLLTRRTIPDQLQHMKVMLQDASSRQLAKPDVLVTLQRERETRARLNVGAPAEQRVHEDRVLSITINNGQQKGSQLTYSDVLSE